ncbi:MAG TPA: tetratricopeptide repeat protein [Patescibacteria group bacterium]|nr:tetratricopeptide repeat protein [Patescibacteria group bacterium]
MRQTLKLFAAIVLACGLGLAAGPAAAQGTATVTGVVKDMEAKPFAGATIAFKNSDTGAELSSKIGADGKYSVEGLRSGIYDITVSDPTGLPLYATKTKVESGGNLTLDLNLKDLITPEQLAERKRQAAAQQGFVKMKAAFDAGQVKVEEADKARADMLKSPADQRAAQQPKVNDLYSEALQDFQQAQQVASAKDPNMHLIYEKLGYTNEMLGHYDEAITDYQKAIELKPTVPEYYSILSLALAKTGKAADASQACDKATSLDQAKGSSCYLNVGITLYNKYQLAEAVAPLQKATELNPKSAQAWYLLGASLVATMTTKQEGEKMIPVLAPGTVEAYQKCIELDPNGPWGAQAKAGLEQLQAMGAGVDTKIKVKKGKG